MAWEPALDANALIVAVVSSLLSVFAFSACICSMAVNFAIGALTFVAVSGSTASSTASTAFASATIPAMLGEKGGPCGCVSEFFGEAGCRFFF